MLEAPSIGKYFSVGTLHTKFSHTAKFGFYFIDPNPTFAGAYIMTIFLCVLITLSLIYLFCTW